MRLPCSLCRERGVRLQKGNHSVRKPILAEELALRNAAAPVAVEERPGVFQGALDFFDLAAVLVATFKGFDESAANLALFEFPAAVFVPKVEPPLLVGGDVWWLASAGLAWDVLFDKVEQVGKLPFGDAATAVAVPGVPVAVDDLCEVSLAHIARRLDHIADVLLAQMPSMVVIGKGEPL